MENENTVDFLNQYMDTPGYDSTLNRLFQGNRIRSN